MFNDIYKLNLFASIIIIVAVVMLVTLVNIIVLRKNLQRQAVVTSDEIAALLAEPMYKLDSSQIVRIAEAVLSSERVSGISIKSDLNIVSFEHRTRLKNSLIHSQERIIVYQNTYVGSIIFDFNYKSLNAISNQVFIVSLLIILALTLVSGIFQNKILIPRASAPFSMLVTGIGNVADGNYKFELPPSGYSDMDNIISLINNMANKVKEKNDELARFNESLEEKVETRTVELKTSLDNLAKAQEKLIESSKLSALGHLSAGIAHELNTPLAAIISSFEGLKNYLGEVTKCRAEYYAASDKKSYALYKKLIEASIPHINNFELTLFSSKQQKALAKQLEEMHIENASTAAYYIANLGVNGMINDLEEYMKGMDPTMALRAASQDMEAQKILEIIRLSSEKSANVVGALRAYLKKDNDNAKESVNLKTEINKILILFNNSLKHGVKIKLDMDELMVTGSQEKLSQVFMNLIRNSAQAMNYKGSLEISVKKSGGKAVVSITDSGPGISEENKERIFDPFFTTKNDGEGMGLGLDLVKRIAEAHGGSISVDSRPGRTVFVVELPIMDMP
ncbi:hypothetical protein MASR2M29_05090 [Spirochaetota bacterium]